VTAWKRQLSCNPDLSSTILAIERIISIYERDQRPAEAGPWHKRLVGFVDRSLFSTRADTAAGKGLAGAAAPVDLKGKGKGRDVDDTSQDVNMDLTGQSAAADLSAVTGTGLLPPQVAAAAAAEGGAEEAPAAVADDEGRINLGGIARFARSYIIAAKLEMGLLNKTDNKADDSSMMMEDDAAALQAGSSSIGPSLGARIGKLSGTGNLALAYDYLQKVVIAGTEVTDEAEDLLKQLAFRD
jgi:hypothetical protein